MQTVSSKYFGNYINHLAFQIKLLQEKDVLNELNQYSQNFQGLYCTCQRPYPDPDNDDDDTMVQCAVCEDWFHSKVKIRI